MSYVSVAAAVLAGLAVAALALGLWGAHRWERDSHTIEYALEAEARPGSGSVDASALPDPVQRFATILGEGAAPIRVSRMEQSGTFRMGESEDSWKPFTATEIFTADPVGFVWDASIRMLPGVPVRVRDTYVGGEGTMKGAVLGLLPVVDMAGSRELSEGALARYLAEAVWIPTRLVRGRGLTWEARDDSTARATLADGGLEVSLDFTFDAEGRVTGVEGLRAREVDGVFVPTRWVGRFAQHEELDGYTIPTYGEVAWEIDGELRPYWRGTIDRAEFTR